MFNPQVHYRTSFEVKKSSLSTDPSVFQTVVNLVGNWLYRHGQKSEANRNILKPWLFRGGTWRNEHGAQAEVRVEEYDEESRTALYWVFRYEHPDRDNPGRVWRTDVALTSSSLEAAVFSVTVTWYIRNDFFGKEPVIPQVSVPRIVRNVLESDFLYSFAGMKRLQATAQQLFTGDGKSLYEYIINIDRKLPVLVMNINSLGHLLNPDGLQKILVGSGIVYWYDDVDVYNEMNYMWGGNREYQCAADTIRVYMPSLDRNRPSDYKRHRYFALYDYEERSGELLRIISQNLFRMSAINMDIFSVTNIESLNSYIQRKKLKALKDAANLHEGSIEDREYIHALEQDNEIAHENLRDTLDKLKEADDQILDLAVKVELLEGREAEIENQYKEFALQQAHFSELSGELEGIRELWKSFPTNLEELLVLFKAISPDKIVILDDALRSARESKFQHLGLAWEVLTSTSSILHDLYFKVQSGNFEMLFANQTGLELTLKESSATKDSTRLMALRKRNYNGELVDICPHIKAEKGGRDLRLHYFADNVRKLIVIGHFGDHLETVGTTRRKEST
ncbi:hypothetical protein [Pseudobacter ginsenosidimutans]|uniref:Uncharacterized protein n=1 Tax=Pseudobacter ginsenosidimutans TaxID=661488 RepID=A0A4Q7MLH5_9BACT|nr:hypothetical protein [Pseudobacter ginsenosidimutans]QEC40235.1 hypothetical protein FSB84_00455 [Pseudobacter ginsenosidimutans]RZS69166.1 hypothetical protein EV199_4992 [Pseudobacter ginsenosidimutans]